MEIKRPESRQRMPDDAKLVFKGVMFDTYQWEQELYDGRKATFEKLKRPDTVQVFPVMPNGKILLTKQEQPGKFAFIGSAGGRVDPGEDILDATKRELLEETGCTAEEYILWHAEQPISKIDWAVYTFIAKGITKVADLTLDGGEKIETFEVTLDEFIELATTRKEFGDREIYPMLMEAKYDPEKKKELEKLFSI